MFTGIIESMGAVKKISGRGEDALLEIDTSLDLGDVKTGDSIAVSLSRMCQRKLWRRQP